MVRTIPELTLASTPDEIAQLQVDAIVEHGKQLGRPVSILEAGCGQCWLIDLSGLSYQLTGIDLDSAALELRKNKTRDLDVAICGDLCSVYLPEASFDVVYSSYVLEHVPNADVALKNFVKWLRPGGLLILRLPDPTTVRGFFARVLPYKAHLWFYRYAYGQKQAGQPGHAPYPTFYHPVIGRKQLCSFIAQQGMKCIGCYGDGYRRDGSNEAIRIVLRGISKLTSALSFGKLTSDYADLLYIAVKNGSEPG
jgi:SAM-dependent methyltransferase